MNAGSRSWRIIPFDPPAPFRRMRVLDEARVQAVVRHLLSDECVTLLGPPLNEKSHLLLDVAAALRATDRAWPLYIDLWRTSSQTEEAFFTSLARLISGSLAHEAGRAPAAVPDARAFRNFLAACVSRADRSLALLIDHLQALPHDLVHSLLLALRSAYMERDAVSDAPQQLMAVVTGGMNLVGLSTGPTSPFNIAKPVVAGPLTEEQTVALAQAIFADVHCAASAGALEGIVEWSGGDRFLVNRLCEWSAERVQAHRQPHVTRRAVDESAQRLWLDDRGQAPIREAVRMIEEDPDTMLDVLHLLDHGSLPRARSRQMITRTGTDRLQLSGAAVLTDGRYTLLNRAYQQALARHFTAERVGHILRIAGRWAEAIEYLAPRLAHGGTGEGKQGRLGGGPSDGSGEEMPSGAGHLSPQPLRGAQSAAREPQSASHSARPQLLEAIVQSIYAADSLEKSCDLLATGLRLGFALPDVGIYTLAPAQGQLKRVYPGTNAARAPEAVDLYDPDCVEARTFRLGNYALRGTADEARLVVALTASGRPIGIATVEHYVQNRDPHELPSELPDLLHFLQHAASAMENAIARAAFRKIGQAVLNASAFQPTLDRVLEAVSEALGCDYAALYLVDASMSQVEMAAGVGRPWSREWLEVARYPLAGRHPAASCLRDGRALTVRGTDERLDPAAVARFGLHPFARTFLPLSAAGDQLGTLELGYSGLFRASPAEESRRSAAGFADQVAIAVHNMELLRRTDEALARRVIELEKLRSSSLAISSTLDLDAVLRRILQDVQALFPGADATIWEYRPEQRNLAVLQSSLGDPSYLAQRLDLDSVAGQAVTGRRTRIEADLAALNSPLARDLAARLGLRSLISVPLISRDRVLGVICIYTYPTMPAPPGPNEIELLEAFAAQAAVAVDNARLHREELRRQRLEEELAVGRQIQLSMLPKNCPEVPGWEFAAAYSAARIVGGDFYDFYTLPGQPARLGMIVADVAGKGVPAALFMALSRTIIRTTALNSRGPAAALMRANDLILKDSPSDMFLTACYATLDLDTGRLIYANAGHNRPLWYHAADGSVTELDLGGIILGVFERIQLREARLDLAPGDLLLFYTDGITEAVNEEGEMFGEERLQAVIPAVCRRCAGGAAEIVDAVTAALAQFTGGLEAMDDVTCVVVRRSSLAAGVSAETSEGKLA